MLQISASALANQKSKIRNRLKALQSFIYCTCME